MSTSPRERYVLLGLAQARGGWLASVARWTTSGAVPAELVTCVSAEEVRAHLGSGRRFSALVAEARPAVDRDLVATARAAGCAVLVVDDGRTRRDWQALGAAAVLTPALRRDELVAALAEHARLVAREDANVLPDSPPPPFPTGRGLLVAVTGPGGAGASTLAIALAQTLADERGSGAVVLADLCRHAEQAMLHDAGDVAHGIQELVDAHRAGRPDDDAVRGLTFAVPGRGYDLLLGLRRARFWPTIRPRALEAAVDSLVTAYEAVVADVDPDVEGEEIGGSADVEDRNAMARTAVLSADAIVVVGQPTLKGLHSLTRVVHELAEAGANAQRLVPVVNRSPRSPRTRAGLTRAFAALLDPAIASVLPAAVHVPERRVDEALYDVARLPDALGRPLAGAVTAVAARESGGRDEVRGPGRVRPGTLGRWAEQPAAKG